ncbi:ATP-binding protein [Streptomyces griseoviridis]|uniref:ATP-binding protein n=1 Tax=Streptomyces griseoviridis TaxID=45398 RepID=UPI00345270D7
MPKRAVPAETAPPAPAQAVTLRLPRHRRSVSRARAALREQLALWHIDAEVSGDAALLLSELVTNAVKARATPGREIGVLFESDGARLRLEVSDASDDQPVLKHAKDDDESGRGLALVAELAHRWGTEPRDGVGKVVWAELLVRPDESEGGKRA